MAKLTMLAALLDKLEGPHKNAFIGELTELIKSKTGGLDFKISENDITKTVEPGDLSEQEQLEAEKDKKQSDWFQRGLKTMKDNSLEGMKAAGINIQEM